MHCSFLNAKANELIEKSRTLIMLTSIGNVHLGVFDLWELLLNNSLFVYHKHGLMLILITTISLQ